MTLRERAGRLTVQAWFQLVLGLMALLAVIGSAAGAQVIANTNRVADRLLDQLQPAESQTYRLQSALINQETGVRGYTIAADPAFLTPYAEGKQDEADAAARIRELLVRRPALLADLDALEQAAEAWRTDYAEPLTAAVARGGVAAINEASVAHGKTAFDDIRARFTAQNARLDTAIDEDRAALRNSRFIRNAVLSGVVAAFLLAGIGLTFLIRRLVARPLSQLESASLRVAEGDFEHRISLRGPADLTTVARAVEQMRRRVVEELASSRAKETILIQQAAELDGQTEELRRSNAELEQFAYVASHDLQEPLRKIASFCQLLEKRYGDQLDERATQYITYAVDGAKRMQVLINDLLTFSRVGRVNDNNEPTSLDATLDKAMVNLASAAEDADLLLERPEQLPEIIGDSTLLTMLWQNLIANAIKFHRPSVAPVVRIDCEPDADGWRISVTDNGIGIAPEFADKVFVIFQRLHHRTEYSGTGIGLAICKKIVEFHGGKIWIDLDYSDGARFYFTVPSSESAPEKESSA